jgi:hypothetical protein
MDMFLLFIDKIAVLMGDRLKFNLILNGKSLKELPLSSGTKSHP